MDASPSPRDRKKTLLVFACAFLLFAVVALMTKCEVTIAGNESSRFGSIQAFAEQNSFAINDTVFRTVDMVKAPDGHVYSDKPLVMPFFHALLYKALHGAFGITFESRYFLSIYLVNLLGIGLLNVLLFLLFFRRLDVSCEAPLWSKLLLSASLLKCTLLFPYGLTMNNHTPAALLLFLLMTQLLDYEKKGSALRAGLAGLTAGFLFDVEFPVGGFFGLGSFAAVAIASKDRRILKLAAYSAGGLLPIAFMALLNKIALGHFLPQYVGAGGTFSFAAIGMDKIPYLFNLTFGTRGLFSYTPALLFIVPALLHGGLSRVERAVLWTSLAVFAFYVLGTNEYGGWSYGFRYFIPLVPILWFFIARRFAPKLGSGEWQGKLLCLLLLWGLATSYVGAYNPWCSCSEGPGRTLPTASEYEVRSGFLANLLCLSFESNRDSALLKFMVERVYGPVVAARYMNEAFINTKQLDRLAELREYAKRFRETESVFPPAKAAQGAP